MEHLATARHKAASSNRDDRRRGEQRAVPPLAIREASSLRISHEGAFEPRPRRQHRKPLLADEARLAGIDSRATTSCGWLRAPCAQPAAGQTHGVDGTACVRQSDHPPTVDDDPAYIIAMMVSWWTGRGASRGRRRPPDRPRKSSLASSTSSIVARRATPRAPEHTRRTISRELGRTTSSRTAAHEDGVLVMHDARSTHARDRGQPGAGDRRTSREPAARWAPGSAAFPERAAATSMAAHPRSQRYSSDTAPHEL